VRKNFIIMAVVAFVASSGGYFLAKFLISSADSAMPGPGPTVAAVIPSLSADGLLGQRRPDFTLSDINGMSVSASDFEGNILLVNFWATWCTPCVEEMPMLSLFQQEYAGKGVKIVGIALDDAERASEFATDMAIGYPILVGQADVVITGRRYGNNTGMLPFSVLIDAKGIIRWTRLGPLTRKDLKHQIQLLR
jgi:thiol-disulfide isomerase/thioredoxin